VQFELLETETVFGTVTSASSTAVVHYNDTTGVSMHTNYGRSSSPKVPLSASF